MACYKISLLYIISGFDRLVSETQMRNRHAAGLLGVVLEVSLYLLIGMVSDNLYRVLVCTYRAISTQTPELAGLRAFRRYIRIFCYRQRQSCYVVVDGDCELLLRAVAPQVLETAASI